MLKAPKLWVVTRGGTLALECEEAHAINPVQSALFGFEVVEYYE